MKKKIIVATRPSLLAYTQTMQTVALLEKAHPNIAFEVQKFSTQGDRDQRSSLTQFGGTGVFVKELEHALQTGQADIAIHSLKDMPSEQPENLCLTAFPEREDPRDVLIIANPKMQKVGTGSPRRLLQCALQYPKAEFVEIRGNIETRLQKMQDGLCDATFLAMAGLNRIGRKLENAKILDVEEFIPAIGQGALAIECRKNDTETQEIIAKINHKPTELAINVERAFMKEIQGGCKFPLAGHAYYKDDKLRFLAIIGDLATKKYVKKAVEFELQTAENEAILLAKTMKEECEKENIKLDF